MVTFLFHAVGTETLMALVAAYYDVNQDVFEDSREQHMAEASSHLEACKKGWFEKLPPDQQAIVTDLPQEYHEAFRICQDLSILDDKRYQVNQFFMSYGQLANRIGVTQKAAAKILQIFDKQKWLKIEVKGTQHCAGAMGKATLYSWTLPVAMAILILSMPHIYFSRGIQNAWPLCVSTSQKMTPPPFLLSIIRRTHRF